MERQRQGQDSRVRDQEKSTERDRRDHPQNQSDPNRRQDPRRREESQTRHRTLCGTTKRSVRTSNLLGLTFDSRDLAVGPVRSEDLGAELRAKNHPEVGLGIVQADGDM